MTTESNRALSGMPSTASSSIRVLLVEDNPGDARLIHEMLRDAPGIALETVNCLSAAATRLAGGGIALVLLDLGLPDSQGLETLTTMLRTAPVVPVVALTGLDDDQLALAAVQAGAQDYLTKNTVTPEILRRTVRHAIERKRAEEALREHELMINAIVESSQDWIWAIDRNGRHTYSNRAVESILGYSPAEFQGLGLDLVHPDDKPLVEAEWPGWVAEQRGWQNRVLRWRAKDGSYRYLESTAVPILSPEGELVGFRGVDRDITERKRAEAKLQEQLDELRRWQAVMLGTSDRSMKLKREVNELLRRLGEPVRYPSQESEQ